MISMIARMPALCLSGVQNFTLSPRSYKKRPDYRRRLTNKPEMDETSEGLCRNFWFLAASSRRWPLIVPLRVPTYRRGRSDHS